MNNRMRSIIYAYLGILIPLNFVVKFTPLEVFASGASVWIYYWAYSILSVCQFVILRLSVKKKKKKKSTIIVLFLFTPFPYGRPGHLPWYGEYVVILLLSFLIHHANLTSRSGPYVV